MTDPFINPKEVEVRELGAEALQPVKHRVKRPYVLPAIRGHFFAGSDFLPDHLEPEIVRNVRFLLIQV